MTPQWIDALIAGAAKIGTPIDAALATKLARFADLLATWGAKMDLSSISDPAEVREKHFVDSLAGLRAIREGGVLVDLGSGGGFPGLVLAAARPDLRVISVESRSKKGVFQRQVARDLQLPNVEVRTERAEDVIAREPAPRWVTARALSELHELLDLTRPWLEKGATLVAWKSSRVDEELAKANLPASGLHASRLDFALPERGDPRTLVVVSRA